MDASGYDRRLSLDCSNPSASSEFTGSTVGVVGKTHTGAHAERIAVTYFCMHAGQMDSDFPAAGGCSAENTQRLGLHGARFRARSGLPQPSREPTPSALRRSHKDELVSRMIARASCVNRYQYTGAQMAKLVSKKADRPILSNAAQGWSRELEATTTLPISANIPANLSV